MGKIRFPLELADGTKARSLDDLKDHFDLESVLTYYSNGKLLTWLQDRFLEDEVDAIAALDDTAPDFQEKLCAIFGVEYTEPVDMETLARRQERIEKLKQYTDDDEVIKNVDLVAFDQEELANLLDDGCEKIYLYGDKFAIPSSQEGKTYIGVNEPQIRISGKVKDLDLLDITVIGCEVVGREKTEAAESNTSGTEEYHAASSEEVSEEVADCIFRGAYYRRRNVLGLLFHDSNVYVETENFVVYAKNETSFDPLIGKSDHDLYAISKIDGEKKCLLTKDKFPRPYMRGIKSWISVGDKLYAYFSEESSNIAAIVLIDVLTGEITETGFEVDYRRLCAANNRYFVYVDGDGNLTCIDLHEKKRYRFAHRSYDSFITGSSIMCCTEDKCYFIGRDDPGECLIEYSFDNREERVIVDYSKRHFYRKIAYFDHKIFVLGNPSCYYIGYFDLATQKYVDVVKPNVKIENIEKRQNGFLFVESSGKFPIKFFDFRTKQLMLVAQNCAHTEFHEGGLFKKNRLEDRVHDYFVIGNWLYYQQGKDELYTKVSLDHPMQLELVELTEAPQTE